MRLTTITALLTALPVSLCIPQPPKLTNLAAYPQNYAILVFPGFQALDVFGPLDVLNTLSFFLNDTMKLSVLSRTLNPVTTKAYANPSQINIFAEKVVPTHTFRQLLYEPMFENSTANIDVLIVPGGGGTRDKMEEEIEFVKKIYPKVKYILSVCTGSTVLARAGILDGKNATSNKKAWQWVQTTGPKVKWIPSARWVNDGNIWTSSGISAGIDLTYAWVEHVYGAEAADYLGKSLEYKRWEGGSTNDPFAKVWEVPGS